MKRFLLAILLFALMTVTGAARVEARDAKRAAALYRQALGYVARNDVDARRMAIRLLEDATLLDPGRPEYHLTLGRAYYEAGFLGEARDRFERVTMIAPDEPEARYGLGQVWRRDWLHYADPASLNQAVKHFSACCRMRVQFADGWLELTPLLVEQKDLRAASVAARRALEASPGRPEALIAVAYTDYLSGDMEGAAEGFRVGVPGLPRLVRARFVDIAPVATDRDTFLLNRLEGAAHDEFLRQFWADMDPDLTTAVNEARLEYLSRVAHAFFLYYRPKLGEWDERGEVYVRYGPPSHTTYNPIGDPLRFNFMTGSPYPANTMVWTYQDLRLQVVMQDRTLNEYYQLPVSLWQDPDPIPHPAVIAASDSMLLARSGRGVFRTLPPGTQPLQIAGAVGRFYTPQGPRLFGQVEVPGTPEDSVSAAWVVLDSARTVVVRGSRSLVISACDPVELQVADFVSDIRPGTYTVGLSVKDREGRRGTLRRDVVVPAPLGRLTVSDVVITCGTPYIEEQRGGPPIVRIEPNPTARVPKSGPLTAYFEVYELTPDAGGRSRFHYEYTVRSAEKDPRIWVQRVFAPRALPDPIQVSHEEEQVGSRRRQFVSVPVSALPPGRYQIEILVRDVVSGQEAKSTARFSMAS